jgi:heme A synthase
MPLSLAVALLGLTVLLGGALATSALRHPDAKPPRILATLHGFCAALGYGLLLVALQGPARGTATGTQSFGIAAAILLLLAAMIGATILAIHYGRRRLPGFWVGAHAMIAITGYVILAVYLFAG